MNPFSPISDIVFLATGAGVRLGRRIVGSLPCYTTLYLVVLVVVVVVVPYPCCRSRCLNFRSLTVDL